MASIPVPAILRPYGVQGIFVGGCVERGDGSSFRRKAHAHNYTKYPYWGWVCIRSAKRLWLDGTGKPSTLLWHEAGHIWRRSWTEDQVEAWARRQVRAQGGRGHYKAIRDQRKGETMTETIIRKVIIIQNKYPHSYGILWDGREDRYAGPFFSREDAEMNARDNAKVHGYKVEIEHC